MFNLTPTAKSSFIAGIGLSVVAWLALWHLDEITRLLRISRWLKRDTILNWIVGHKAVSLTGTEIVNFTVHGITNPASVTFALGATVINSVMIYGVLPVTHGAKRHTVGVGL